VSGREYFKKAVKSYDDKPRRLWVFDYPAQTALCGIQIWWTSETNDALSHLELGHENALKEYNKKQVELISRYIYKYMLFTILQFKIKSKMKNLSVIQFTQLKKVINI